LGIVGGIRAGIWLLPAGAGADALSRITQQRVFPDRDENATPELSLRFNFPVKQGTYELIGTDIAACNNCSVTLEQNSNPFAQYTPQKLLVSITSLTAKRVAGTFSGTLEFGFSTPDRVRKLAPPIMRVDNGQFDIPIAQQ
jgi:hypothetical protein